MKRSASLSNGAPGLFLLSGIATVRNAPIFSSYLTSQNIDIIYL